MSTIPLFTDSPNYESASFPPPRPFQVTAHESLREGARAGHKNQMVMAPTGAGKLFLGLQVAHEALKRGRKAIFVCDRTTLINQASAQADQFGLSAHGIMQADNPRTDPSMPFQIASAQTLARRDWPDADVIIIDEAHTQLSAWTKHIPDCRAKVVGLSATPFSRGLGKLFTNLINATTAHELTESGVLVPMRVLTSTRTDMTGAATSGGEWTDAAAAERGMAIIGDVVSEWCKTAYGKKTIVFGATIAHCEEMARAFNAAGIEAAVFSAHTTPPERKALLDEYRKTDSRLRVLISVEALAKGFDVPDVECVCDCRPLQKSLSTAIQMWGRGLRSSPGTGKDECLLLDFTGNILRFAEDYTDVFFNGLAALDAGEKLDKVVRKEDDEDKAKNCPACGYHPFVGRCMSCGHEVKRASNVEVLPGAGLHEIKIGKTGTTINDYELWQQACAYARGHSSADKQRGRAYHLYRDIAGREPSRMWNFDNTPPAPISREVLNMIKAKNIAYANRIKRKAA